MIDVLGTGNLNEDELRIIKLLAEMDELLNSLEVGVKLFVGKTQLTSEDLEYFCANFKGSNQIIFNETDEHFELIKLPKTTNVNWLKSKIYPEQNKTEVHKEKYISRIKKHLVEYIHDPVSKLKIYSGNLNVELMRIDFVVPFSYIQRRVGSIINQDKKLSSNLSFNSKKYLDDLLIEMCEQGILVELDKLYCAKFNTTARLFGINVEKLK